MDPYTIGRLALPVVIGIMAVAAILTPAMGIFTAVKTMTSVQRFFQQMEETRRSDIAGKPVRLHVHYVPIDVKASKYERWEKLRPRFERGSIVFSDDIAPSIKAEIKNELVRGQAARFKDFLDAMAMAETGVMPKTGRDGNLVDVTSGKPEEPGAARGLTFKDVFGRRIT